LDSSDAVRIDKNVIVMKRLLVNFLGVGAIFLFVPSTSAQSYSIDWFTIDGGGGTSTGGVYSLSGTIGQPDAGRLAGGNYTLDGGFWAGAVAVQTPGAPTLNILPGLGGVAIISWSPATPGFVLQVSDTLTPPDWSDAPNGGINPATVSTTGNTKFYRLHKP
jgi:hypothetical protein